MFFRRFKVGFFSAVILLCPEVLAAELSLVERTQQQCLLDGLRGASSELTVGELRQRCVDALSGDALEQETVSAQSRALVDTSLDVQAAPRAATGGPLFAFLRPHKPNYMMLGSIKNSDQGAPFAGKTCDVKFQVSVQTPVGKPNTRLENFHLAYTQRSWWDVCESSMPFAESNYNPEFFWRKDFDDGLLSRLDAGFEHQSNGQDGVISRSWDRWYVKPTIHFPMPEKLTALMDDFLSEDSARARPDSGLDISLKFWHAINVAEENHDIKDYLGNWRLYTHFKAHRSDLRLTLYQGSDVEKLSYQVDLSLRLVNDLNVDLILSYVNGYGESLISYNEKTESVHVGISFPIGD